MNNSNSNDILMLKYKRYSFSCEEMKFVNKTVYEMLNSGEIVITEYFNNTRRIKSKTKKYNSEADYKKLVHDINNCIDNATHQEHFIDDCECTLTIYYPFGRKETMDRGLGNEDVCIEKIIEEYIQ